MALNVGWNFTYFDNEKGHIYSLRFFHFFQQLGAFVNNLCYLFTVVFIAIVVAVNTTKREMKEMKSVEP